MVPHEEYFALLGNLTLKDLQDIGENADDFFEQRSLAAEQGEEEEEEVKGPFIRSKTIDGSGRMACYSMFTVIDSPKKPRSTEIRKMV
ncbi:unnamed protein product, partial [Larinioides sclopetarius]